MSSNQKAKPQRRAASTPSGPETRFERRQAARVRRNRTLLVGSVIFSAAIVATWFPFAALFNQRHQLSTIDTEVALLAKQDRQLHQEQRLLSQPGEISRLAQQQYQLVKPGQTAYQVLPPSRSLRGGSYGGDPAYQPLVSPSAASDIPVGSPASAVSQPAAGGGSGSGYTGHPQGPHHSAPTTLFGRILNTLEFWR